MPLIAKRGPRAVDIHVGKRLRRRRLELGLSQEKLGSAADITFQQIAKYERGVNRVSASRIYDLAKTLKVNPSYFLDEIPDSGAKIMDTGITDFLALPEGTALAQAFPVIRDSKVRQAITRMVRTLAKMQDD